MGRSSVSQRGFVSAVLTLAFVAVVVGLAANFLLSRNSDSAETLARAKASSVFAKQGALADVADAFAFIADNVCVEHVIYNQASGAITKTDPETCQQRGSLTCPCYDDGSSQPDTPEYLKIIPTGKDGVFRVLRVTNSSPNYEISDGFPAPSSEVGGGATKDRSGDSTGECFSGDTLVLIGGSETSPKYKRIDELKVGDYVMSVDHIGPEAAMIGSMSVADSMKFAALRSIKSRLKPVRIKHVFEHLPPNEGAIRVKFDAGEIVTTKSHPFMLYNRGWNSLIYFVNRGFIVSLDGSTNRILSFEKISNDIPLYNLSLQESFTYFVLPNGASSPLWVHNAETTSFKNMGHNN